MKINVGISNRHIHLTEEDLILLTGSSILDKKEELNQPNEYASRLTLTIKTSKNQINNVRVLGPTRNYTQVEISKTDSYFLGINPPVKTSGDLLDACEITIVGPNNQITKNCCIIASRHIHINKEQRKEYNLDNIDKVSIKIDTEKAGIIQNVMIKETNNGYFEVHLDTDDANSFLLKQNDEVKII